MDRKDFIKEQKLIFDLKDELLKEKMNNKVNHPDEVLIKIKFIIKKIIEQLIHIYKRKNAKKILKTKKKAMMIKKIKIMMLLLIFIKIIKIKENKEESFFIYK